MIKIFIGFILIFSSTLYADTEIFEAAKSGDITKISQLLTQGVDINERNNHKWTPLIEAISWGNVEAAKFLVSKNALVTISNDEGNTPLHIAAFLGQLEIVKLLLIKNIQIDKKNNDGQTALHLAAQGDIEVVKYLLKKGAKQEEDKYGNSVLDLAGSKAIKELLVGKCITCNLPKEGTYRKKSTEKSALEDAMYTSEVGSFNSLNNKVVLLKKDYNYTSISGLSGEVNINNVTLKMRNTTDKDIFSIDVFVAYYDNQDITYKSKKKNCIYHKC